MTDTCEGTSSFIKGYDLYGQSVGLNYQGEDTFKTCPGGILSILILITLFFYSVLKLKYMVFKEEWELIQQNVVSSLEDLSTAHDLGKPEYQNLSIAL
mmetsp:Transcript_24707/g.38464  ORF Transcript_24707/g.38464 Transcript_24707/m.38464 type:complete len:98 (+) Transcript_24707:226-519(+)